ncbi:MAG: creatininase family protein [Gemmatimonadales bacterium]|jgi:creatinine amidohydrolase|nr:creatininase family protein [Gemmatimonadales bacterium]
MSDHGRPWRLKTLLPGEAAARLAERPFLILPVGGLAALGPDLPLGTDTIIVEHLADDISARRGIVRAPALEYGVHPVDRARDGGAALRRKTLHRVVNELIDSWETRGGVRHILLLTALGTEAQLEALGTVRAEHAEVVAVDVLALELGDRLRSGPPADRMAELVTSLMLHLFPALTAAHEAPPAESLGLSGDRLANPQTGRRVYDYILERLLHLVDGVLAGR